MYLFPGRLHFPMSSVLRSILPNVKLSRKQYLGQHSLRQRPGSWISTLHFCRQQGSATVGGDTGWVSPNGTEGTEQQIEGRMGG